MLKFKGFDLLLGFARNKALSMQLAVGAGMGLGTW
jgi:hypothetical protein